MKVQYQSSVFFSFLLISLSTAHTDSQSSSNNNNVPLFGNVMRYFGESETGYGLQSSGLFEDVDTSQQQQQQQVSMCLPNFEVSIGSIIRTKDSQALGAHYLNETDLGAKSRDECLKLCCKVSRCNVAVFEEKNSGSCYLFDCGSLEDFRCKFTTQSHYVSAILRRRETAPQQHNSNNNPNPPEHSGSIMGAHINSHSHNQHEDELSQLRESDKTSGPRAASVAANPVSAAAAEASNSASDGSPKSKQAGGGGGEKITHSGTSGASSSSSTTSPVVLSDVTNADSSRRCSRWQFECKSSGECIAIYNVCDAIPNCPDGSDEGPELHCPVNNGYSTGVGDASTSINKQKGSSSTASNPQVQPQLSPQQQNHHPQPPVLINGAIEKSATPTGNNGPGSGIKPPLRQAEEYSPLINNLKPQHSSADIDNGIRKNDESSIFRNKEPSILDNNGYGSRHHPSMQYSPGQYWKQPGSSSYDYGNAENQNLYGPLPPPPQYTNNMGNYGTNYGNSQYQYNGYTNLQGPPQQQSSSQGLPVLTQGQPQYPLNNVNYNPQQQPQQPYYNTQQQQSLPIQGNSPAVPANSQTGAVQPTNVKNTGTSQQTLNAVNPSKQQTPQQVPTIKPNDVPQGVLKTIDNNNSKVSLSKFENDFMKNLKAQSLQSGTSVIQSEELSPHTAGAGAVFIFILGLGMSIVMVLIVGCRLRRVARRQRGKNRLDPDYLVDGMYL